MIVTDWAVVDNNDICVTVQVASQEWVDQWVIDNPDADVRYMVACPPDGIGRANPGYRLDKETGRFIPPDPGIEGVVFDREAWDWVSPSE